MPLMPAMTPHGGSSPVRATRHMPTLATHGMFEQQCSLLLMKPPVLLGGAPTNSYCIEEL